MKIDDKIWNNKKLFVAPTNFHKEFFDEYKRQLIFWNRVAKGGIDKSSLAIEKQFNLVEEEKAETEKALMDRNKIELIDGLCDVVFTEFFYEHLLGDTEGKCLPVDSYYEYILDSQDDNWQRNIRGLICSFDGDWKGALNEVMSSNWTKFDVYDEISSKHGGLYDKHCEKLKKEGHFEVRWTKQDDYVVYQNENKKVLKGSEYRKPQLEKFI